jgi:hypothetical protein
MKLKRIYSIIFFFFIVLNFSVNAQSWTEKLKQSMDSTINKGSQYLKNVYQSSKNTQLDLSRLKEYGSQAVANVKSAYDKYGQQIGKSIADAYDNYGPTAAQNIKSAYDKYGVQVGNAVSDAYTQYGSNIGDIVKTQLDNAYSLLQSTSPWAVMASVSLAVSEQTGAKDAINEISNLLDNSKIKKKIPQQISGLGKDYQSLYVFASLDEDDLRQTLIFPATRASMRNISIGETISSLNFMQNDQLQKEIDIAAQLQQVQDDIRNGKSVQRDVEKLNELTGQHT